MEIAKVHISGVEAQTIYCKAIPRGVVGAKVGLEYDGEMWSGLTKKVLFTNGLRTVELLNPGDLVVLPPEVVDTVGKNVSVGVCGTDATGKLIIPTLWTALSWVRDAVPVEADEAAAPTPPIWAQLLAMIGNLKNLETDAKDNLVAAVNELVARGGDADPAEVQRIVEEYLAANMPEVDLPAALPNPHPLRFTGAVEASYDGSEEMTVEIPQGGGGECADGGYKTLEYIVLEEEQEIIIIGTDVQLEEIEVYVRHATAPSASARLYIVTNSNGTIYGTPRFSGVIHPQIGNEFLGLYKLRNNWYQGKYSASKYLTLDSQNGGNIGQTQCAKMDASTPVNMEYITEYTVISTGSVPAGTEILIRGR